MISNEPVGIFWFIEINRFHHKIVSTKYFSNNLSQLSRKNYFDRIRELSKTMTIKAAWEQTESELPHGLRRFTNYISFEAAKTKEASGNLPKPQFKGE